MANLPSRNRAFARYQRPGPRQALNAQRLLEAICRDLAQPELRATLRIRAIRTGSRRRFRLEYDNAALACARVSFLTRAELNRLRTMVNGAGGRFRVEGGD